MKENKQEHFIKNIEIKNFKCFEDFNAEGFGRVNLIGGKNNVGKTAFMEALLLTSQLKNDFQHFFSALFTIENNRKDIGNMDNNKFLEILYNYSPLHLIDEHNHTMHIHLSEDKLKLIITGNDEDLKFDNTKTLGIFNKHNSSFIPTHIDNAILQTIYDGVKRNRKRDELNNHLKNFDIDLSEVDILENTFKVFSISRDSWVSIFEYGEGVRHYLAYISAIWANKDGHIFIDEIENGIHYSNLDKLWKIILKTSKEANVQVFATTHSKECIESYARVAKKLEDEEITYTILTKLDDGSIDAGVYDSNMIINTIEQEHEVRGW